MRHSITGIKEARRSSTLRQDKYAKKVIRKSKKEPLIRNCWVSLDGNRASTDIAVIRRHSHSGAFVDLATGTFPNKRSIDKMNEWMEIDQ